MSDQAPDDVGAGAPTAATPPPDDAAPASSPPPAPTAPPPTTTATSTPLLPRERAERGPGLGGALAIGVVVAAALPCAALVWLVARGPASPTPATTPTATATAATMAEPATTTTTTTTTTTSSGAPDAALTAALAALEQEAVAAGRATLALTERAEQAERGARVRATQKLIARARDARRAAGQSGPALKGPFPVAELGDLDVLQLSARRWLITRDGAIVAPANVAGPRPPAPLATTGREEDLAAIPATVDGTASTLLRHCVPFEPWCLVDVVPATPPPVTPAVDLAPLRALLATSSPSPTTTPPTTTAPTMPAPPPMAPSAPGPTSSPTWPLLGLAGIGLAVAVAVASRLRQLGSLLRAVAWRLRAGLHGRGAPPAGTPAVGELAVLEAAVDEAHAAVARLAAVDDESAHRRRRLEATAAALQEARTRGGVAHIDVDDADDAATARVVAAVNALLETLDARHRRIAMAATEAEGTMRLVTPLSQRLLRLARLEGLPPQAADELTSLGTSLGQRARRPQVLPGLLEDLGPLAPPTSSIVDIAAAVEPLGDEGARLAARQLEGLGRDPQGG